MDDDMAEDVFKLAEALDTGFLDVQADAATAIAGLSSDGKAGSHLSLSDLFPPQDWNIRWLHLLFFLGQLVKQRILIWSNSNELPQNVYDKRQGSIHV